MSFKIASWNIRGFNDPSRQKELRKILLKEEIKVMGVLETKIKDQNKSY